MQTPGPRRIGARATQLTALVAATLVIAACGSSSGGGGGGGGSSKLPDPVAVAAGKAKLPALSAIDRSDPKAVATWFAVAYKACSDEGDALVKGLVKPGVDPYDAEASGYNHGVCRADRKTYTGIAPGSSDASGSDPNAVEYDLSFNGDPVSSDYYVKMTKALPSNDFVVTSSYL